MKNRSGQTDRELIITGYRFSVKANMIVMSEQKEWIGGAPPSNRDKQNENLKDNRTRGVMSDKSSKRLKAAVNWLVVQAEDKTAKSLKFNKTYKWKINFFTLTIPPQKNTEIDEKQYKELLNTFLTYHRKYSNLGNYVWKIETHKDGRFHFHITADKYIFHKLVRSSWNEILRKAGLLDYHFEKFGNYTPPSTEVKSVVQVRNLGGYISKYMSKDNMAIHAFRGRVWGCSRKISQVLDSTLIVSPNVIGAVMEQLLASDAKEIMIETEPNVFGRVYRVAQVYLMDAAHWLQIKGSLLYAVFFELISYLRDDSSKQSNLQFIM